MKSNDGSELVEGESFMTKKLLRDTGQKIIALIEIIFSPSSFFA